jgi:branched-chain amino acid transport system substrate-binding protein
MSGVTQWRRGRAVVAVCAAALGLAACGSSSSAGTTAATTPAVSSAPLVIGASVALTGDFADSGKAVKAGYDLWADTVNAKGGILGRKVEMKVVDDASSPTQVVTNYQNLINKDKVDLVFGPFSSLLTVPAAQVAKRYGYAFLEPAGGGPKVFDLKLDNLFFVQPAPVVKQGEVFANYILSLPQGQRPATAAYNEMDDPFAQPVAETIRTMFEAAGIKTVLKQVYPAEQTDFSAIVAKTAAAHPDVVVGGTQSLDAYAQVKSMVQLKFNPKFLYFSNGANAPVEFPNKVGAGNTAGIFTSADWFPGSTATGSSDFTAAYIKAYGGTADTVDDNSAEAYACGQILEAAAAKTGKIDNASLIAALHQGTWPTILGDLSWDAIGQPSGSFNLVQWQGGKLVPVFPTTIAKASPIAKPNWAG